MELRRVFFLVAVGLAGASCAAADRSSQFVGLGEFLDSLMADHDVPGVAFAAFDDNEVLYQHVAGYKNQETKEPIDGETAFEAASISKPLFAYIFLTLARDGLLDLDQPLSDLPPDLADLEADPRSAVLTPRMVLSHVGGLPNWRARMSFEATRYDEMFGPNDTLKFVMDPNTGYRYSGEGYVLLQRVVERKVGRGLNDLASDLIFGPLWHVEKQLRIRRPHPDERIAGTSRRHEARQVWDLACTGEFHAPYDSDGFGGLWNSLGVGDTHR